MIGARVRLRTHTDKYRKILQAIPREVGRETSADIISGSPVDTGLFRRSWTPSIGSPRFDNSGGSAAAVLQGLQPGQVYYFVNGQPYGPRLEYESWSPQAPNGMVGIAVAQHQARTDQIVARLRRGI